MFKSLSKALSAMRHTPQSGPFFGRFLKRTKFDYAKEVGDGLDASVVTAPVAWMARAMPEARLVVRRRGRGGKLTELTNHKMLDLVARPNAYYGDVALWSATVWSWCVAGNAYWIKVRSRAGRPVELWYVPHWCMDPVGSMDGTEFLTHYKYSPGGGAEPVKLEPQDVVHFRAGLDPRNPRMGLSPLGGVIREIFMDLEASNFVASLLRNMGVPGVVISPKGGAMPTPDDLDATKTWFKEAFGGDNRGGPLVMGAPTDVSPYGFNPQQMNMSEARDVAEERVCACIGIPAAVVGFGAGLQQTKVGATMTELRKLAWHNGVLPLLRMLADELNRSLMCDFGDATGLETGWDTDEVLALSEDQDKEVNRWDTMIRGGWAMISEGRSAMGLDIDDSHNIYLRPISSIEVAEVARPREARAQPAPRSDGTDDQEDEMPEPKSSGEKAEAPVGPKASRTAMERGSAFVRRLDGQQDGLRIGFERQLSGFFEALGRKVAALAEPRLQAEPKEQKAAGDDDLIAAVLRMLGIVDEQASVADIFRAQFRLVADQVAMASAEAGLGTSLPDAVARAVVAAGGRRAGLIDLGNQTRKALFDALAAGRAEGEGAQALALRIRSHVASGPWASAETRARTIARTETKYAQNVSTIACAEEAGVIEFIVFDGRLGPGRSLLSHMARHGSIVSAQDARDMADAEHPNGTLSFAPHFGGDEGEDEEMTENNLGTFVDDQSQEG